MRGPSVYPEPSFYHNMSTLCYFIKKSSTSVYQYRYFVYFHNALKHQNNTPIYRTGKLPGLVCGTRLVTGARLLSVQMNQTRPVCGAGVCLEPGCYPKFYGTMNYLIDDKSEENACSLLCRFTVNKISIIQIQFCWTFAVLECFIQSPQMHSHYAKSIT